LNKDKPNAEFSLLPTPSSMSVVCGPSFLVQRLLINLRKVSIGSKTLIKSVSNISKLGIKAKSLTPEGDLTAICMPQPAFNGDGHGWQVWRASNPAKEQRTSHLELPLSTPLCMNIMQEKPYQLQCAHPTGLGAKMNATDVKKHPSILIRLHLTASSVTNIGVNRRCDQSSICP
jgi:hypothetical protein